MKYTCIYCKKEKDKEEFNREHIVPQMMGKYTNGLVLSSHQVCEECNSYFCRELENKIGLDSYEALLRMRSGTKIMSDGRRIKPNRLSIVGAEGILKGVRFIPVSNSLSPERFLLDIEPCVGLALSENEYEYFTIDNLPDATEQVLQRIKNYHNPIIQFGYKREDIDGVLREKGYINDTSTYTEKPMHDEYESEEFETQIRFSVDSIVRRVCAKTVFNYLCFNNSAEYMLDSRFDALRNYIRYGIWDDSLWFRCSSGYVSAATPPNDSAHVVGTMLGFENGNGALLGCVTWFGEITYILKICEISPSDVCDLSGGMTGVVLPTVDTQFTYFNNETTEITTESALFIYGGSKNS